MATHQAWCMLQRGNTHRAILIYQYFPQASDDGYGEDGRLEDFGIWKRNYH